MSHNPDNPSTTFFWNDWDNEPGMKFCDLAAQGLWVKLLSLAARSREYGVVLIGDHPSLRQDLPALLASGCGESAETVDKLLDQLVTFKVASIDDRGRVFNRRMVAEAKLSAERAAAGRRGADVTNAKRQTSDKGVGKQGGNARGNGSGKPPVDERPESAGPATTNGSTAHAEARQISGNPTGKSSPSSVFCLSSVSKDTGAETPRAADNLGIPPFLDRRQNRCSAAEHVDVARIVFNHGLDWLERSTGKPTAACRTLLGKWRKDFGDDAALIAALGAAQREGPIDAVAWMEGAIRARRSNGTPSPRAAWADGLP